MSVDVKYRTSATATGGRDGQASSTDGSLNIKLSLPKELGGAGGARQQSGTIVCSWLCCMLHRCHEGRRARAEIAARPLRRCLRPLDMNCANYARTRNLGSCVPTNDP
jgi:hypothetical protein